MRTRLLVGVMTAVAVAATVAGILALGSPATARERRFDERRIEDLTEIDFAVREHRTQAGALPATLGDLQRPGVAELFRDPSTRQPYEYRSIDSSRYELCAVFQQPSRNPVGRWQHAKGRQCFARAAK